MTKLKGKISFFTSGWLNVNMPCVIEVDGAIGTSPLNETDPTVPFWAKQSTKPTYTASEVGALPSDTLIPTKTSDLNNDSGFLTEHQPLKTINSESIVGSGNIDIGRGGSTITFRQW